MLYYIKSAVRSQARNGNMFYKLSLVSEAGSPVEATCFVSYEVELQDLTIQSDLDAKAQYPKVEESELQTLCSLDALESAPAVFLKFKKVVPTKDEFLGLVTLLLEEAGKATSKFGLKLIEDTQELYAKYSKAVAAKVIHHAFEGGLALHTYEMLKLLYTLVKDGQSGLPFKVNILHCLVGILFHDYGKLEEYSGTEYTEVIALTPHNFIGAKEIEKRYASFFKDRILKLIQHIILSHHGNLEWGATCVPATLEAFLVHHIDMLSGHGNAMASCVNMEKCASSRSMVIVP